MRLSLRKGAHAALSSAAWQEIRVRSGRDDKFIAPERLNCRSLGFPGFPVELGGAGELHAPFFTERRTRGPVLCCVAGNPGSLGMTKGRVTLPFGGMVVTTTAETLFIPDETCRRQVTLLLMTQAERTMGLVPRLRRSDRLVDRFPSPSPDFLWNLVALAYLMRLSLLKGARAASSGAAWQEIRSGPWIIAIFAVSFLPQLAADKLRCSG